MLSTGRSTIFSRLDRYVAYAKKDGYGQRLAQFRNTGSWTGTLREGAQLSSAGLAMRLKKEGGKKPGKVVAKGDLPSKICVVCNRPFTWWENLALLFMTSKLLNYQVGDDLYVPYMQAQEVGELLGRCQIL